MIKKVWREKAFKNWQVIFKCKSHQFGEAHFLAASTSLYKRSGQVRYVPNGRVREMSKGSRISSSVTSSVGTGSEGSDMLSSKLSAAPPEQQKQILGERLYPLVHKQKVIAENLSEEEIVGLKEMFKSIDTDNSGTVTFEELKAGLPKLGTKLSESEVGQLMEAALKY